MLKTIEGEDKRAVDVNVRNLRAGIEPDAAAPYDIETVFLVGYRFRPEG